MSDRKKFRFTNHAREELESYNISIDKAYWMICNSEEEKLNGLGKNKKYQTGRNITYYRNGTVIFTVKTVMDRYTDKPVNLIVSIYDQKLDLLEGV